MAKKKSIKSSLDFSSISASLVLKNLPFIFFLSFLGVLYIANAHYSEKKVREIQDLQSDLKQMRWQYMSIQAEVNFSSKRSEVIKSVEELGLKASKNVPNKIIIDK